MDRTMNHLSTSYTVGILAVLLLGTFVFQAAYAQSLATPEERRQEPTTETLQVRILTSDEDLDWTGTIMGSDMISSTIEGEGDHALLMRCDDDDAEGFGTYSVDVTKEDDNDEALAIQIVQNGTILKEARTEAEFGWVSIAGDC
jgi:hypothetical protein